MLSGASPAVVSADSCTAAITHFAGAYPAISHFAGTHAAAARIPIAHDAAHAAATCVAIAPYAAAHTAVASFAIAHESAESAIAVRGHPVEDEPRRACAPRVVQPRPGPPREPVSVRECVHCGGGPLG